MSLALRAKTCRQNLADLNREEASLLKEVGDLREAAKKADGGKLNEAQSTRKGAIAARLEKIETEREDATNELRETTRRIELEASGADFAISTGGDSDPAKDPKRGFKDVRELLVAVVNSGSRGKRDPRLEALRAPMQATVGSDEHSGADNTRGGFLIPDALIPGILTRAPEADPFAGATSVPMEVPTIRLNARVDSNHSSSVSGGLTVTRRPETVAASSSRMALEQIQLNATGLFGLSYASEELINDSPISIAALLQAGFRDEFVAKGVDEKINGSGVGEPEGVLTSPALITVSAEAGQAADTITYNNILAMRARSWGYGNAVWIANHDTLPTLSKMTIAVGLGGSVVFVPNTNPATLLGRPIIFTEYAKTVGDVGDLILVNPTQYLEGSYQPLQNAESVHVRFVEHERAFKVWIRNDGKCWWRAALTPKNSTSTLSPFVALAAR